MKKNILFLVSLMATLAATAQNRFYNTVKIEFEKTLAMQALYKELAPEWYDQVKDRIPQNTISYFDFIADSSHSVYKPGRETGNDQRGWFMQLGIKNVVYTDYQKDSSITQKPVYEETFLVQDSLLKIKWKKVSRKTMLETLYTVMKDWDIWGKKMLLVTQI